MKRGFELGRWAAGGRRSNMITWTCCCPKKTGENSGSDKRVMIDPSYTRQIYTFRRIRTYFYTNEPIKLLSNYLYTPIGLIRIHGLVQSEDWNL